MFKPILFDLRVMREVFGNPAKPRDSTNERDETLRHMFLDIDYDWDSKNCDATDMWDTFTTQQEKMVDDTKQSEGDPVTAQNMGDDNTKLAPPGRVR